MLEQRKDCIFQSEEICLHTFFAIQTKKETFSSGFSFSHISEALILIFYWNFPSHLVTKLNQSFQKNLSQFETNPQLLLKNKRPLTENNKAAQIHPSSSYEI